MPPRLFSHVISARWAAPTAVCSVFLFAYACQTPISTERVSAYTGTLGEEIHRVFCQRFASEAYPSDVSGGLTASLCRGTEAPTASTEPHLAALANERGRVAGALDTMMPEDTHSELFDLLAVMLPLYDDGTLPESTRAIADVNATIEADPETVAAFARFSQRRGYRPMAFGLGLARPALRYPELRAVVDESLGALAPGGVANGPFLDLLRGGALELATLEPATGAGPTNPTTATLARNLLMSENTAFSAGMSRFAVVRDPRGLALPRGVNGVAAVPAPFVDADNDKYPDVDDLGRYVGADGAPLDLPAPFAIDGEVGVERDVAGRATASGQLVYQYRDLDRTMLAGLVREGAGWFDPADPTLVQLARALPVMMGSETSLERTYGSATLTYPGFDPADGPAYDLLHAALSVLHRQETVDGLRVLEDLMTNHEAVAADLVATGLYGDQRADVYPGAALAQPNVFWDDMIAQLELMAQIKAGAGQTSMMEGVARALATPEAADLDEIIALYATHRDAISFDGTNFATDGGNFNDPVPAGPLTQVVNRNASDADPQNESLLQRSVYLIRDLDGVRYCNKPNAELILRIGNLNLNVNASLSWTGLVPRYFAECELLQIDNVAKAYAQSTWGGYELRLKGVTQTLINAIKALPGGAGLTDNLLEATTGITGMGTYPTAPAMARFVFGYHNANLQALVNELPARDGALIEDRHCLGRAPGVRNVPCPDAVIFAWEKPITLSDGRTVSFLEAIRPVLQAMDEREADDQFFFGAISNALHMHYPSRSATRTQRTNPNASGAAAVGYSYQDNIRSYEPLFAEIFQNGHLIERLGAAVNAADGLTVRAGVDGVTALGSLIEVLVDPNMSCVGACSSGSLRYRDGTSYITYNNGTRMDGMGGRPRRYPSPMYLLLDAISGVDDAWVGNDTRHDSWLDARSELVDQFFTTEVVGSRRFANRRGHNVLLLALPFIRGRIEAHRTGATLALQNTAGRAWATERETSLTDLLSGPVIGGVVRLLDAVDQDPAARDTLLGLLSELMNEAQSPEGTAATLYAASDLLALLDDDQNVIPMLNTLSVALSTNAEAVVAGGGTVQADDSVAARTIDLLARTSALDTTGVLSRVLANAATHPSTGSPITPVEALMDAIAEVNRTDPGVGGPVATEDVTAILASLIEFLTSTERGLERLYAVIENRKVEP